MLEIQLSNPQLLFVRDKNDSTIEEALETIFPRRTEYAFIIWDRIFIPVSYKYDISIMVNDFINIVDFINDINKQDLTIAWASNTFASVWNLHKNDNIIKIESEWTQVMGELENLLNNNSTITVECSVLKENIVALLVFLRQSLDKCNYANKLEDYDRIANISL